MEGLQDDRPRRTDAQQGASPSGRHLLIIAAVCCLAAAAALWLDLEIARHCMLGKLPGDVRTFLAVSELFAHGSGILLLSMTVMILDPKGRARGVRLLGAAFGAGALALIGKVLVGRTRPKAFDFDNDVWHSFVGWLPAWSNGDVSQLVNRAVQSMPSGHTASAFAMAFVLSRFYPRGRWFFPALAVLVMAQRVTIGAHFASDTLIAAGLGSFSAWFWLELGWLGKLIERIPQGNATIRPQPQRRQLELTRANEPSARRSRGNQTISAMEEIR